MFRGREFDTNRHQTVHTNGNRHGGVNTHTQHLYDDADRKGFCPVLIMIDRDGGGSDGDDGID